MQVDRLRLPSKRKNPQMACPRLSGVMAIKWHTFDKRYRRIPPEKESYASHWCLHWAISLGNSSHREKHSPIYPGPPNWESVKTGDRPERIWHVKLKKASTLLGDSDPTSQNEKESGVKELQLIVVDDKLADRLRKHMGATILFRGALTHAITGHHHLPVLMEVESFRLQQK